MSALRFEYHPAAIEEANHAYRWYLEQSPQAANRFWEELVSGREKICQQPDAWTPYYHGSRCYQLRKFPYGIVYVRNDELIIAVAICHLHRKPEYCKKRMGE
ncbi:MAG: plasmid stabilization protein [Blastopirellula sp.]|nr:MAG: plasmid stabilization protein [Blastopirellula sp.]